MDRRLVKRWRRRVDAQKIEQRGQPATVVKQAGRFKERHAAREFTREASGPCVVFIVVPADGFSLRRSTLDLWECEIPLVELSPRGVVLLLRGLPVVARKHRARIAARLGPGKERPDVASRSRRKTAALLSAQVVGGTAGARSSRRPPASIRDPFTRPELLRSAGASAGYANLRGHVAAFFIRVPHSTRKSAAAAAAPENQTRARSRARCGSFDPPVVIRAQCTVGRTAAGTARGVVPHRPVPCQEHAPHWRACVHAMSIIRRTRSAAGGCRSRHHARACRPFEQWWSRQKDLAPRGPVNRARSGGRTQSGVARLGTLSGAFCGSAPRRGAACRVIGCGRRAQRGRSLKLARRAREQAIASVRTREPVSHGRRGRRERERARGVAERRSRATVPFEDKRALGEARGDTRGVAREVVSLRGVTVGCEARRRAPRAERACLRRVERDDAERASSLSAARGTPPRPRARRGALGVPRALVASSVCRGSRGGRGQGRRRFYQRVSR